MFVELHIIQNVPPSNLNRDDTGSPKDCEAGRKTLGDYYAETNRSPG